MNLRQLILTKNDCYKAGEKITPKGVMVHSTAANNPWLMRYVGPDDGLLGQNIYGNHWNMSGVGACVHAFIGKLKDGTIATYQTLPWDHRGWHCYHGNKGSGNDTHISFEICEADLNDATYFKAVYQEAVELTAMLCKKYNLDPLADGVVICHSEGYARGIASNHGDVMHWFPKHGKSMDTFRKDVKAAMNPVPNTLYRIQVGAFSQRSLAEAMLAKLKKAGFDGFITTDNKVADPVPVKQIEKGSTVRVKQGAKTYDGGGLADFVYNRNHTVYSISGNRVVIDYNGVIVAAVHKDDLILV